MKAGVIVNSVRRGVGVLGGKVRSGAIGGRSVTSRWGRISVGVEAFDIVAVEWVIGRVGDFVRRFILLVVQPQRSSDSIVLVILERVGPRGRPMSRQLLGNLSNGRGIEVAVLYPFS
jgi:hypothetical protein